jgi:hypothetical protein
MRLSGLAFALALSLSGGAALAQQNVGAPHGGEEGVIDINAHFVAELGKLEPSQRETTWQDADIKIFNIGAGYTVGAVGPLSDFYARLEGGFYISAEEEVEDPRDDLPLGTSFYSEDTGGYVSGMLAANFVHEPRYTFGAFLTGTVPIDVELAKFSNVRLHYVGGGFDVGVFITDPTKLVRLTYGGRLFVGSGAFDGDFQHNAAISLSNLFSLEFARWILPWRVGVAFGPYFEADLNEHIDRSYHDAYARVTPDFVEGDAVRAMRFAMAVMPFIRVTDHATLELAWVQNIVAYDAAYNRIFSGGVRIAF